MESLFESAQKTAKIYERAFCIECSAVDTMHADGIDERQKRAFCNLCSREQIKRKGMLSCANIHRDGVFQAERWGGKYEYLCPAGAAFICAALKGRETLCGITAGPFIMVEHSEFKDEDLERFFNADIPAEISQQANNLTYYYSGRVSYITDTLYMVAFYTQKKDSLKESIFRQIEKSRAFSQTTGFDDLDADNSKYPIEHERLLYSFISQGNKEASQRALNEILGHIFFRSGGNFEFQKARIVELVVILSRAAIEGGADITEVFGINSDFLNDIQSFSSPDELNQWLSSLLIRFTNSFFSPPEQKHSQTINRVISFIRKNYMKKISLNDISRHMNMSVSYLCRLFKEETDTNINAFINNVRIENAKLFLLDNEIPLIEAAYLSGFEDQSYFSKVFKKYTNMTPGKYRENKGRI